MLLIIILTTLLKRVVGVARAAKVVIVHIPRSNKGHLFIVKTCFLAPLSPLFSTSTLNTCKLISKQYPLYSPLALYFRSLLFSIVLNHCIIRLAVIFIIKRIVIVIVSPITKAIFQT
jgi:hypothetical protein